MSKSAFDATSAAPYAARAVTGINRAVLPMFIPLIVDEVADDRGTTISAAGQPALCNRGQRVAGVPEYAARVTMIERTDGTAALRVSTN